jgi:hypothetical protein
MYSLRKLGYCPDRDNGSKNSLQLILFISNREPFVSEIMLEYIIVLTIISELEFHTVPLIKFEKNVFKNIVLATTDY